MLLKDTCIQRVTCSCNSRGLKDKECEQIGVNRMPGNSGWTIDPLAAKEVWSLAGPSRKFTRALDSFNSKEIIKSYKSLWLWYHLSWVPLWHFLQFSIAKEFQWPVLGSFETDGGDAVLILTNSNPQRSSTQFESLSSSKYLCLILCLQDLLWCSMRYNLHKPIALWLAMQTISYIFPCSKWVTPEFSYVLQARIKETNLFQNWNTESQLLKHILPKVFS